MRYGLSASNTGEIEDRCAFPAQSSVLDEQAVRERIVPQYRLPNVSGCVLFSRGDSDIYQLQTSGPTYYLKIYRPPNSLEKAEAEGVLVNSLQARGANVVPAVPRRDGRFATSISASEGTRVALVFAAAPPHSLNPDDEETFRRLGDALSRLHVAGDSAGLEHLASVFDEPLLLPFAARLTDEADFHELHALHERIQETLGASGTQQNADIGWCHGDLGLCNLRAETNGDVVFFDFGSARFGSRAMEIARLRSSLQQQHAGGAFDRCWLVLQRAYARVRSSPWLEQDEAHWRMLRALLWIRWIGGVMSSCPLRMGTETFNSDWVRTQLGRLRDLVAENLA